VACLEGYIPDNQREELEQLLINAGYGHVIIPGGETQTDASPLFRYKYIKASGMLKLIEGPNNPNHNNNDGSNILDVPKYIPVQIGMENVLVANGWSFLDPDESEPISAFDLDAANKEGQYKPKWGLINADVDSSKMKLSSLGYNLRREPRETILEASGSAEVTSQAKKVMLEGGTDPPNIKLTNNGYDFNVGSVQSKTFPPEGIFVCAIGSLPLFSTADLPPAILSSSTGWLSFERPIAEDHVELIRPDTMDLDQRVEVVDARTGCHLGHYFGSDGFCINASALNFVPSEKELGGCSSKECIEVPLGPTSWRSFLGDVATNHDSKPPPAITPSREMLKKSVLSRVEKDEIILGAGCFWHVEFALRRLPGVIDTVTGYAGGALPHPTYYRDICNGKTGHAEVVKVIFDPLVCDPRKLIDCWLAMHDPTRVRSHGKKARKTGQYRSCAFVGSEEMQVIASDAIASCQEQLGKEMSSEVERYYSTGSDDFFWAAEERHQRHDERRRNAELHTLSFEQWLMEYGRRNAAVFGSSESIQVEEDDDELDDGMARMMI